MSERPRPRGGASRVWAPAPRDRARYDFGSRRGLGEAVLTHTITLIPGDGTGPEIVEATRRAIEATGVKIEWDVHDVGMPAMAKHGTPFPKDALESVRRNRVALKGPLTTELGTGFRSVNVALRKEFDLYANLRPAKTYPGVPAPRGDVDLVVVRENIEDLYAGIEFDVDSPEEREVQAVIERVGKSKIREHSALAIKANIGENGVAMFEAIHGSAPKYAGQNKVNPMALMLAGVLMLRHIGEREPGDRLEKAIASVVAEGRDVTYDLKADRDDPTAVGTKEFADAVIKRMRN